MTNPIKYRAVKRQLAERVWYGTQSSMYGHAWRDDSWPKFDSEHEVRAYVDRLNRPVPVIITTIL